ncbi:MAG: MATE family efflux transporter [Deltaproteobacteria bacterium]|nr:MATE family efflux transporter [Deltaproteobacteria bacterium]
MKMDRFIDEFYRGPGGIKALLTIATPVMISYGTETVMMFTDRLFLSRLGREHLSAGMSGSMTTFLCMSLFLGIVSYVNALVAQHYGAGKKAYCSKALTQGLIISLLSYPIMIFVAFQAKWLFVKSGHAPDVVELEYAYLSVLIYGSLISCFRTAFSSFFAGIGRTRIVMIANFLAMLLNIPFNYVFIFGKLGFPAMGIRGAAYGTLIGIFGGLLLLLFAYFQESNRREFQIDESFVIHQDLLRKLVRYGFPSAVELTLNISAFTIFLLLFQSYGKSVAAAVTIAFNWDLVSVIPILGLGIGSTALVGQRLGARDIPSAKQACLSGVIIAFSWAMMMSTIFLSATEYLVRVFIPSDIAEFADVRPLGIILLRLTSLYLIFDACLVIIGGALRGAGDTVWIMWMSVAQHWLMMMGQYYLIKIRHISPTNSWLLFVGFVIVLSITFMLRYRSGRWQQFNLVE